VSACCQPTPISTMKAVLALALVAGAGAISVSDELSEWALREHFAQFEERFSKAYATLEHREHAFLVFVENLEGAIVKNAELREAGKDEVHGITKFSDLTPDEFAARMLSPGLGEQLAAANRTLEVATPTKAADASSFDWRESGMVTAVKNQAYCGSCWAHSAVETIESQYAINGGELTSFSTQQLTSCDTENQGCNGGMYTTAWEGYVKTNGGLTTEAKYPYDDATANGDASKCDAALEKDVVAGTAPTGDAAATPVCTNLFRSCSSQDEDTLKANLVSHGPISIAVDASAWSSYTGNGVFSASDCSNVARKMDHAVQLVGYNADADKPYWIVRNSWTTDWGVDGYIHLEMGGNTCGLANNAYMVTL